ncbi:MAG: hypothetical protein WBQ17_15385 [Rhizomicrobium sp.]
MSEPDDRDRTNLLVLGIFIVIVIVGGFVMYLVKQNLDLQRCEAERRLDCHAVAIPNSDPQPAPQ